MKILLVGLLAFVSLSAVADEVCFLHDRDNRVGSRLSDQDRLSFIKEQGYILVEDQNMTEEDPLYKVYKDPHTTHLTFEGHYNQTLKETSCGKEVIYNHEIFIECNSKSRFGITFVVTQGGVSEHIKSPGIIFNSHNMRSVRDTGTDEHVANYTYLNRENDKKFSETWDLVYNDLPPCSKLKEMKKLSESNEQITYSLLGKKTNSGTLSL